MGKNLSYGFSPDCPLIEWTNRSKLLFLKGITKNLINFIFQNTTENMRFLG